MNTTMLSTLAQLCNDELLSRVKHLVSRERDVTATLVAHLAELDVRGLYLAEGCGSLFTYCTQILHLSEHAAYDRIQAARASRKFPIMVELLSDGSVNLSTVCLLAPHLTPDNHRDVLDAGRRKTKRQVEELVAQLRPQPSVPDAIRRLPARPPATDHMPASSNALLDTTASSAPEGDLSSLLISGGQPAANTTPPRAHRPVIKPLAPERYRVQFTANAALHKKLRQVPGPVASPDSRWRSQQGL